MKILFIGNIQKFKKHSQFKSLKDFNNNIEQWMVEYKHIFTKSELICLKRLIRYSAEVPGVCTAMIKTILEAIKELDFEYGVSRSTFKRMIVKAKRIGLLEVKEAVRSNMSQSSNIYIFQRFNTIEPPQTKDEQVETASEQQKDFSQLNHLKTSKIIKTNKQINKRIGALDDTFALEYVPKQFRDLASCFFDEAKTIEEFWRMAKIIAYKSNRDHDQETILDTSIHAFKQMINKLKKGKVSNPFGYFYGILKQKYEAMYFEELHEMGIPAACSNVPKYNWLES